jgi:hypothetical protein
MWSTSPTCLLVDVEKRSSLDPMGLGFQEARARCRLERWQRVRLMGALQKIRLHTQKSKYDVICQSSGCAEPSLFLGTDAFPLRPQPASSRWGRFFGSPLRRATRAQKTAHSTLGGGSRGRHFLPVRLHDPPGYPTRGGWAGCGGFAGNLRTSTQSSNLWFCCSGIGIRSFMQEEALRSHFGAFRPSWRRWCSSGASCFPGLLFVCLFRFRSEIETYYH